MSPVNKLPKKGMWDYLDSIGVLENGTDAEIKAAKRAYRKKYFLEYKRSQRKKKPEYTINFNEDNGEHNRVILAAKNHDMTIPQFLRSAVRGYLERKYVVPNAHQVAQLEQLLSQVLNEIQGIARKKEKFFWERNDKLESIEHRIERLELEIDRIFRHPVQA
jgi:hypothetical protein